MTNQECNKIRDILMGEGPNISANQWPIMEVYHILQNLEDTIRFSKEYAELMCAEETVAKLIRTLNGLKEGR